MNKRQELVKQNATLRKLEAARIIYSQVMGMKYLVSASSGQITPQEFNLPQYLHDCARSSLPLNFHPGSRRWDAWVRYQDRRAKIAVTSGHPDWQNTPCDLSSHFPVNDVAMEMLRQPTTKWLSYNPGPIAIYGDAVLITDFKQHWWMASGNLNIDEVLFAHENLFTPRTLYLDDMDIPYIHFLEKPQIEDLVYLKMVFYER